MCIRDRLLEKYLAMLDDQLKKAQTAYEDAAKIRDKNIGMYKEAQQLQGCLLYTSQLHLFLPLLPMLFMVKLQDLFLTEEKQASLWLLELIRLTAQSRTVFLLLLTLLQNLTMRMLLTVSPILRQSTRMHWVTAMRSVQTTLFMYLTVTSIRAHTT